MSDQGKTMRFPWNISDDEHVERTRRVIAFWDGFRFLLLFGYVLLTGALIWLAVNAIELVGELAEPDDAPAIPGLFAAAAATAGIALGWIFGHLLHGIIFLVGGFRSERLLLKYYDRVSAKDKDVGSDGDPRSAEPEHANFYRDNA